MIICFRDALQQEKKTDRPPRELIAEESMKVDGAAVLDVARESGLTHMILEQYVRKSEQLQTPSVDQFMPQLKFSQMKKRECCPIVRFTCDKASLRLILENKPAHPKNHVETYSN